MPGGKGKSTGGKAGPKAPEGKSQKSHSAKAGLQVSVFTSELPVTLEIRANSPCRVSPRATQTL